MTRQPTSARGTRSPRLHRHTGVQTGVRRIRWLLVIFGLALLVGVGQLVHIQVLRAPDYAERGMSQRARTVELPSTRGRIYDREGDVLATSVESATIYADPRAYHPGETPDGEHVPPAAEPEAVAAALAPYLDRDVDDLTQRLRSDAHFVYLGRQLDWEVGEEILELGLPGVGMLREPQRVYPSSGLAAQVVGFTGIDGDGLQGLEARYDHVLRGEPGALLVEQAPGGLDIASGMREVQPSQPGTDLVLTLDREIQYAAERAAADAVETHDAQGASVIVLDVTSREVLAMASVPTFDPNHRGEDEHDRWRNRAVTDVFEPGSTQKGLTVAAAVEEGLVSPDTLLPVPDSLVVGNKRFTDVHSHPTSELTVEEVVAASSNVGTIQIAQELGEERLDDYLRAFGYGRELAVGFPSEASGLLMPADEWWSTSLPTIAIGQGVAVTLLQLGNAYATLANEGVAVQPSIVRGTVGEDGRLTPTPAPGEERVVSTTTAATVRDMLVSAVEGERATGARAQVAGYSVGGKTGTARKPLPDARGYSEEYVATFVGFAPADDPQLVVAVMVDEPSTAIYGGVVAAPVFSEVMEAALTARRVAPDRGSRTLQEALHDAQTAIAEAEEAATTEEPGTDPDDPASPPAGAPAGSDEA